MPLNQTPSRESPNYREIPFPTEASIISVATSLNASLPTAGTLEHKENGVTQRLNFSRYIERESDGLINTTEATALAALTPPASIDPVADYLSYLRKLMFALSFNLEIQYNRMINNWRNWNPREKELARQNFITLSHQRFAQLSDLLFGLTKIADTTTVSTIDPLAINLQSRGVSDANIVILANGARNIINEVRQGVGGNGRGLMAFIKTNIDGLGYQIRYQSYDDITRQQLDINPLIQDVGSDINRNYRDSDEERGGDNPFSNNRPNRRGRREDGRQSFDRGGRRRREQESGDRRRRDYNDDFSNF